MKKITSTVLAVAFLFFFSAAANAATVNVSIVDFAFSPQNITVNVGDTIVWTNNGAASHTSTSGTTCPPGDGKWDSGVLSSGQSFSFTFTQAGTFPYFCTIHCFTGTVTVNAAPANTIPAPSGQTKFTYVPVVDPVVDTNLSLARPLAIGPLAEGGNLLNVQVGLAQYQVPADIYIAFVVSTDPDTIVNLAPDLSFQFIPFAQIEQALATGTPPVGMTPWMSNVQEPLNVTLFPNLPVTALAPGAYSVFLAATLPNSLANLDLFETDFILGVPMTDNLSGAQEVPPVPSQGTGTANLAVDFSTGLVTGNVSFSGLSSPATAAHIHTGLPGVGGPIIVTLTGGAGGTSGTWTIPPGTFLTAADAEAGLYVNIHSVNFPTGEIRGDLFLPPGSPTP
jgi:plastocyanin